jgi:hypothetical protein
LRCPWPGGARPRRLSPQTCCSTWSAPGEAAGTNLASWLYGIGVAHWAVCGQPAVPHVKFIAMAMHIYFICCNGLKGRRVLLT